MRFVAVTQRVTLGRDDERRDSLDQRWTLILHRLGLLPLFLPNESTLVSEYLAIDGVAGLLLTGGNNLPLPGVERDLAPERDATEKQAIGLCEQRDLPVLGICRGAQVLAAYHGARVEAVPHHAGTKHPVIYTGAWTGQASREVNSYHDFGVPLTTLAAALQPLALADDQTVEAFRHESHPHLGLMWHPEREASLHPHDKELIENLFRLEGSVSSQ